MRERPILFSAPMVRAILEGRKSQTRRIVKPQPEHRENAGLCWKGVAYGITTDRQPYVREFLKHCPYGAPGDRLWVKESHSIECEACNAGLAVLGGCVCRTRAAVRYRADTDGQSKGWRPSIHMPRWASRITLEVTGVRVERVRSITRDDAIAEGAKHFPDLPPSKLFPNSPNQARWSMEDPEDCGHCLGSPQTAFGNLWIKINGAESWDANPYVWVISFRRLDDAVA